MQVVIDIDKNIYDRVMLHHSLVAKDRNAILDAIERGEVLPDDCEILTREAYSDLCMRASGIKGKWVKSKEAGVCECSNCGAKHSKEFLWNLALFGEETPKYCPTCGADMRREEDEDNS